METPVRMTSMGWAVAGIRSRTSRSGPGRARRAGESRSEGGELGARRQLAVEEHVGDFLELCLIGELTDVVAEVGEAGTFLADGAQSGLAGADTAKAGATELLLRHFNLQVVRLPCPISGYLVVILTTAGIGGIRGLGLQETDNRCRRNA